MKQNIMLIAITLLGLASIFGCKKSSSSSSSYSMKATINGAAFNGTNCIAQTSGGALNIDGGNFSTTPTFPYILITISNYTGAGTYALGTVSGAYVDSSTVAEPVSIYGSVVITATSPNITGTFSFTCLDSTKVTNGSFTAKAP